MRLRVPFLGAVLSLVLSSGSAAQDADPQLLARFCGAVVQNADHAALVGRVRDAETGHGLAGVTVVARWEELGVDRTTGSATKTPHTLAAVSDGEAVYRFCAVPRYTPLALQAQAADRMSGAIEIQIAAQPIFVRGISLSLGAAFVNGSGTATLVGEIVSGVGQPVRQARVTLDGAIGEATSNDTGVFVLPRMPAGTRTLVVRALGFLPKRVAVDLRAAATSGVTVVLDQTVQMLDSVRVLARRSTSGAAWGAAFEARKRASAGGTFLEERDLVRRVYSETADIFRTVRGLTVSPDGVVSLTRGAMTMGDDRCVPAFFLDNLKMESTLDIVRPHEIKAIEIYLGAGTVPPEYNDPCGAIVIWTK